MPQQDEFSSAPPSYDVRGRLTTRGLRRRRDAAIVELRKLDEAANDALPALRELPDLRQLSLIDSHGLDLRVVGELAGLEQLFIEGCTGLSPTPLALPAALKRLSLSTDEPGELERLVAGLEWSRAADLASVALQVAYGRPPAKLDLGFVHDLRALRRLSLVGVEHEGAGPSPLEPPFDRLPPALAEGHLAFESADWIAVDAALREHYRLPPVKRWTPEEWSTLSDEEQAAIESEAFERPQRTPHGPERRPRIMVSPPRDPDPAPPPPDWLLYHGDDSDLSPWWTAGVLAPADADGEAEHQAAGALVERIRERDPALADRIELESDGDGTTIRASSEPDLRAALEAAGLQSPGVAE